MSEWICVEDSLPRIGQIVEVQESPYTAVIVKAIFCAEEIPCGFFKKTVFVFKRYGDDKYNSELKIVMQWRPIKEKRPDFLKLKKGDLIIIENKNNDHDFQFDICYYFRGIDEYNIIVDAYRSCNSAISQIYDIKIIKKITRINVENQTFEEI